MTVEHLYLSRFRVVEFLIGQQFHIAWLPSLKQNNLFCQALRYVIIIKSSDIKLLMNRGKT